MDAIEIQQDLSDLTEAFPGENHIRDAIEVFEVAREQGLCVSRAVERAREMGKSGISLATFKRISSDCRLAVQECVDARLDKERAEQKASLANMELAAAAEVKRRTLAFQLTLMDKLEAIIQDTDESAFTVVTAIKEYIDLTRDGIAPQNAPAPIEEDERPLLQPGSSMAMAQIMPIPTGLAAEWSVTAQDGSTLTYRAPGVSPARPVDVVDE